MKESLKQLVDQSLHQILKTLDLSPSQSKEIRYDIVIPKIKNHGDLSVNLAFQLGRLAKRNPYDVADLCRRELERRISEDKKWKLMITEILVEKPGFINFRLGPSAIASELFEIARQNEKFGFSDIGKNEKVMIEFVSANPTGPLTIAHGRQAAIGDALARILTAVGYNVHKEFYLNDSGRQIRLLGESLWVRHLELFGTKIPIPDEGYQGVYLIEVAKELKKEKGDSIVKEGKEKSLASITSFAVASILSGIKKI